MSTPDLSALAQQLAALLGPYLPFLLSLGSAAGTEVVKEFGKKAGDASWERAQQVWKRLRAQAEKQPEAAGRLKEIAARREDPRFTPLLSWELEKLLESLELSVRVEIQVLLVQPAGESGDIEIQGGRNVVIHGGADGATIITGDTSKLS